MQKETLIRVFLFYEERDFFVLRTRTPDSKPTAFR